MVKKKRGKIVSQYAATAAGSPALTSLCSGSDGGWLWSSSASGASGTAADAAAAAEKGRRAGRHAAGGRPRVVPERRSSAAAAAGEMRGGCAATTQPARLHVQREGAGGFFQSLGAARLSWRIGGGANGIGHVADRVKHLEYTVD